METMIIDANGEVWQLQLVVTDLDKQECRRLMVKIIPSQPPAQPKPKNTEMERRWGAYDLATGGGASRDSFKAGYTAAVEVVKASHARCHVHFTGPCQCALCGLVKELER